VTHTTTINGTDYHDKNNDPLEVADP